MEFLVEDHSLWDPMEDPQLAAEYLDFDCLRNDWVKDVESDKLIDNQKDKTSVEDAHNLFSEDLELYNWMETKFDFSDGAFQFDSLDDIESILQTETDSGHNVDIESSDSGHNVDIESSDTGSEIVPESPENVIVLEISKEKINRKIREKPYVRPKSTNGNEFKKSRKRSQNRNAAIRYRMKKREEAETVAGEEKRLQEENDGLNKRVDQLSSEIKYLKGLLKELIRAKSK